MRMRSWALGFTLIELMVTVAIVSILSSVVIPKFGNMVIRAKESSTKGALGALRSALSIYYADNEGRFPGVGELPSALASGPRYIETFPSCRVPPPGNHPESQAVQDYVGAYTDGGDWMYTAALGSLEVNCTHQDSTGRLWSTW